MERQASTYSYSPLDGTKRQIRLLHLLQSATAEVSHDRDVQFPSNGADDRRTLYCYFSVLSLKEQPVFEAVSYVWDDSNNDAFVTLQGHSFPITRNLHSTLEHLRHNDRERVLWVDALCINQADDHERASQVSQMQYIYSHAVQVLVYLGEA